VTPRLGVVFELLDPVPVKFGERDSGREGNFNLANMRTLRDSYKFKSESESLQVLELNFSGVLDESLAEFDASGTLICRGRAVQT